MLFDAKSFLGGNKFSKVRLVSLNEISDFIIGMFSCFSVAKLLVVKWLKTSAKWCSLRFKIMLE